jgi:hypothetical protein
MNFLHALPSNERVLGIVVHKGRVLVPTTSQVFELIEDVLVPITMIFCNDKHDTYSAERRKEALDAVASFKNLNDLTCVGQA